MNVQIDEATQFDAMDVLADSKFRTVAGAGDIMLACYTASISCWVGKVDDRPVCAWGLIPPSILSSLAYIWLLHTDELDKHTFTFVRQSQIWVEFMLESYDPIVGYAEIKNERGIRWLRWLGAEFGKPEGTRISFQIRKKNRG